MSEPGIKYRLDKAVGFLNAVMIRQLAAKSAGASVRWPGRILRASDGTCISKRGSKGTDWRVHGVYDLGRGGFSHLDLTDGHGAEAIDRGAPIPGEMRIGDRNYATAPSLHRFCQDSGNQADFIVRVRWGGFSLSRRDGRAFDLIDHLGTLPNDTVPAGGYGASQGRPVAFALAVAPDHPAQDAGGDRGTRRSCARGVAQAEDARSAQPGRGGVHDPGHLTADDGTRPTKCSPSIGCAGRSNSPSSG